MKVKIDNCMYKVLMLLNLHGIKTLACCCGHGKYHMTIIFKRGNFNTEIFSGITINRKKRFYKRDKLYSISQMVIKRMPIETIRAEIKKCVLLCPNCHAIVTRKIKDLKQYQKVKHKDRYRKARKEFKDFFKRMPPISIKTD